MKEINTGGLSFSELRNEGKYYVDKTLLIKDILDNDNRGVYLFTRPRRFGKTTNLSMLDAFFNLKYKGNTWFDDLEISKYPEYEKYKNAFPVIHLDLRPAKENTYEDFIGGMRTVLSEAFEPHRYLLDSPDLRKPVRDLFDSLDDRNTSIDVLKNSVKMLCDALKAYHGRNVIILIDEYDRAVSDAFGKESHRPMMDFLGAFLSPILKNNNSLQMAYVTGVMQIAKESIFSDLNNIAVDNIFSTESDERFGFTESEVKELLSYYGHPEKFGEAKEWYDGYRFGDAEVYNPFSIMNYVWRKFNPVPYWSNSGGDSVVRWLFERIGGGNFSRIHDLVEGGTIRIKLESSLRYEEISLRETSIFSLMAMSGYLMAVPAGDGLYDVTLPNREVRDRVAKTLEDTAHIDSDCFTDFNRAVLDGDADTMAAIFQRILLEGSYFNLNAENAYGLILMTILHEVAKWYEVRTEYESGNGRTDIILKPRREGMVPMIFELKKVNFENELDAGLDDAIRQIHKRRYYLGMPGKVVLAGMSVYGKIPKARIEIIDNGLDGTSYVPVLDDDTQ